jgi:glycosyltransferase involved in cell wall biosynthesis
VGSNKRILHVYPAQMIHHVATMLSNNNTVLSDYENVSVLVSRRNIDSHRTTTMLRLPPHIVVSPFSILKLLWKNEFDYVIYHSGHWPMFWLIVPFALLFHHRSILIFWGAEIRKRTDFRGLVLSTIIMVILPKFFHVVFLASTDAKAAEKYCGRILRRSEIPYFHPTHLKDAISLSRTAEAASSLRIQIGNNGEPDNDHLRCLANLSAIKELRCEAVLPLGYLASAQYVASLKSAAGQNRKICAEFIEKLLPPEQFDALIDSCDALLLASVEQRALYSIFRYLAAGKPVFLPKHAHLRADLQALGFQIVPLEHLRAMGAAALIELCRTTNQNNIAAAREYLSLESIRTKWRRILGD